MHDDHDVFGHIFHTLGWSCKSWPHPYCQHVPKVSLASDRFVAEGYTGYTVYFMCPCVLCIDCIDSHRYTDHIRSWHGGMAWHMPSLAPPEAARSEMSLGDQTTPVCSPLGAMGGWVGTPRLNRYSVSRKRSWRSDCALKQGFTKQHRHF